MMFDWNDRDQAGGSIWSEFSQNEGHIVPYPKDTKEETSFTFGDYSKKQRNEEASSIVRSTEQKSGTKNDFPTCNLGNNSNLNTSVESSAPKLDMDAWPDSPTLSAAFGDGYSDPMAPELVNDASEAPIHHTERGNMTEHDHCNAVLQCKDASAQKGTRSFSTAGTIQLYGEAGLFNNEHKDKDRDNFLDCDWASIGDLDDLDRIFRNDSFFGHNMVDDGDEFLSPSADVISSTAQSIPIPDMPLNSDNSSEQGCVSYQLAEQSCRKRKPEAKTSDSCVEFEDQTAWQTHLIIEKEGTNNHFTEKEGKQKKLLMPRKKAEEKSNSRPSKDINGAWSHMEHMQLSLSPKMHPSVTSTEFQPPTIFSQQRQVGNVEPLGHVGSYNHSMFSGYGYPTFHFPALSPAPHIHVERNQIRPDVGHKFYQDSVKHSHYLAQAPDELSRPLTMTTQEKIEKLRRRQKMQAILAIQQQQQKFGHQIAVTDNMASQVSAQKCQIQDGTTSSIEVAASKFLSSDVNMLVEHDESQISPLIDHHSIEETIYYQLQDALGKLNTGIRLCLRDSLFRLGRSAVERQSASDTSSSNIISRDEYEVPGNEETNNMKRYTGVPDAEANTNRIDRTVVHLLFARPVKEERPQSPMSCNPGEVPLPCLYRSFSDNQSSSV